MNHRRFWLVELRALDWLDNKPNWQQWEKELRGRAFKARFLRIFWG